MGILLKAVRAADLRDNRLEAPEDLEHLAAVVSSGHLHLHSLNVAGNAFGTPGAEALCGSLSDGISHLDLSRTMVCTGGSDGIDALFSSPCAERSLLSLVLDRNELSDDDGAHVLNALAAGSCKTLTSLSLARNALGTKCAAAVRPALEMCRSLAKLNLAHNRLGAEGGRLVAEGLTVARSLTGLDLSVNRLCAPSMGDGGLDLTAIRALSRVISSAASPLVELSLASNQLCGTERVFINGKWRLAGEYVDEGVRLLIESLQARRRAKMDGPAIKLNLSGNLVHTEDMRLVNSALSSDAPPADDDLAAIDGPSHPSTFQIRVSIRPPEGAPGAGASDWRCKIGVLAEGVAVQGGEEGAAVKGGEDTDTPGGAKGPASGIVSATDALDDVEGRKRDEAVAMEARAKADADAASRAEAAELAEAQRVAEERFAVQSKAKAEADDQARKEAKAAEAERSKLRKLVGPAKVEATARVQTAVMAQAATTDLVQVVLETPVRNSAGEKVGVLSAGDVVHALEEVELEGGNPKALVKQQGALEPMGWAGLKHPTDPTKPMLVALPVVLKPSDGGAKAVVREKPSANSAEVGKILSGARVHVLKLAAGEEGSGWAFVALENSGFAPSGWVLHTSKDGVAQTTSAEAAVQTAGTTKGGESKVGKGAATRRASVSNYKPDAAAQDAAETASPVLSLVQHKRLANVKNNTDTCPVRQRHDGPSRHTMEYDGCLMLIFNCYKAKFEVAEGAAAAIPTAQSYNLTTVAGEVIGSVGVADKKGTDLKERVKFKNAWLPGSAHGLYHPSDQGDASLQVVLEYKLPGDAEAQRVYLLVCPWLSYSCSVGARFLLRKPGEAEGKSATVQRLLSDDRCAMRVDGEKTETLFDPRPDTGVPAQLSRYSPGVHLLFLAGSSCVDAVVEEMPEEEWAKGARRKHRGSRLPDSKEGNKHWIRVRMPGHPAAGKCMEVDLNPVNHCVTRFASAAAYEEARLIHCADIVERERHVEDAITGNTVRASQSNSRPRQLYLEPPSQGRQAAAARRRMRMGRFGSPNDTHRVMRLAPPRLPF